MMTSRKVLEITAAVLWFVALAAAGVGVTVVVTHFVVKFC